MWQGNTWVSHLASQQQSKTQSFSINRPFTKGIIFYKSMEISKHPVLTQQVPPSSLSHERKELSSKLSYQTQQFINTRHRLDKQISDSQSILSSFQSLLSDSRLPSIYSVLLSQELRHLDSKTVYKPSLITHHNTLRELIQQNKIVNLTHPTGRSQLLQLIIGILTHNASHQDNTQIVLYTSQATRDAYRYFCNLDRLEDIPHLQIRHFEDEDISHDNSDCIVFVDLFYSPRLLSGEIVKYLTSKPTYRNLIIYNQHPDEEPVGEDVVICNDFPIDTVSSFEIKSTIIQIIQKSKLYAERADIVIFAPDFHQQSSLIKQILRSTKQKVNILNWYQQCDNNLTNILICSGEKQLSSWKCSFDNVVAVFDYGLSVRSYFCVEARTFVESIHPIDLEEMGSRFSFLGKTKPGKYFKMYQGTPSKPKVFEREDLGPYILRMVSSGKTKQQILLNKEQRAKTLLESTWNLLKQQGLIEQPILIKPFVSKKLHSYYCSPFIINILTKLSSNPIESNILLYMIPTLNFNNGIIFSQSQILNKSVRKQGDISLFVEILELRDKKLRMKRYIPTDYTKLVNHFGLDHCVERWFHQLQILRTLYGVSYVGAPSLNQSIQSVVLRIAETYLNVFTYTGSRRLGYKTATNSHCLLAESNLFSIFNQRPTFILPLKLRKEWNKRASVQFSEKISEENYIMIVGQNTLIVRKSSIDDKEVEFSNLSNAMLEKFWDTSILEDFEKENNCTLQLKKEEGNLLLYCNHKEKQRVQEKFRELMEKLKFQLEIETRVVTHNIWKLVVERGGTIKEVLGSQEYKSCNLINIPAGASNEAIISFLEEYADFEKISVSQSKAGTKVAHLTFASSADLRWVMMELNKTVFQGNVIQFVRDQKVMEEKRIVAENNIIFKWYAWPLTKAGVGIIHFKTHEGALRAAEAFSTQFDSRKVTASVQQNRLSLSGLNQQTDQIFLSSRLSVYGLIEHIQLEKQRTEEFNNAQRMIDFLIHDEVSKGERIHIQNVRKMGDGFRVAKVKVFNNKLIPRLCDALNQSKTSIGKTRLYLQPQHTLPILIRDPKIKKLYQLLLHESIHQLKINPTSVKIDTTQSNNTQYFLIQTNNYDALMLINNVFFTKLKGTRIKVSSDMEDIIFSNIGASMLSKVQQEYTCRFIINNLQKQFGVICQLSDYEEISKYVGTLSDLQREQAIQCSTRTFKILMNNQQVLGKLRVENDLKSASYDKVSKSIVFRGRFRNVMNAKDSLFKYFEMFSASENQESQERSQGVCGICCEYLNHPYKLEACSHSFCEECLLFAIHNSIADISCFPIKCPHCLVPIVVEDLSTLLDSLKWDKLVNISLNKYVTSNGDIFKFCLTPNCQGLCVLKKDVFDCKICEKSYCNLCGMEQHPECTCYEAKIGFKALLKKFIEENDVRICPNPRCKMLMQKISGCNKVLCCRCEKSVCWKCPKEKMLYYNTPRECYDHLNLIHGGYS